MKNRQMGGMAKINCICLHIYNISDYLCEAKNLYGKVTFMSICYAVAQADLHEQQWVMGM